MSRTVLVALFLITFVACCAGAVGTVLQIARIGLGPAPPPSTFGSWGRVVGVVLALALWPMARRIVEHLTLFTFVLGVGASALVGLGIRASAVDAVRVLYHLFMFSFGAIATLGLAADTKAGSFRER